MHFINTVNIKLAINLKLHWAITFWFSHHLVPCTLLSLFFLLHWWYKIFVTVLFLLKSGDVQPLFSTQLRNVWRLTNLFWSIIWCPVYSPVRASPYFAWLLFRKSGFTSLSLYDAHESSQLLCVPDLGKVKAAGSSHLSNEPPCLKGILTE